ncbi:MAG: hypothetical protein LAQ69_00805 [Acidobacteriia bacterium]|nr:hypothetical protein [Terriglobia bacterium]
MSNEVGRTPLSAGDPPVALLRPKMAGPGGPARTGGSGPLRGLVLLTLLASALPAQSVDIYPEFRRVDPFGAVVAADKTLAPREVLSPAVARNAHASFHVVVSLPPQETYLLYVAPNPLNACRVALYKEHFVKTSRGWIPDTLVEVARLPDFGVMPDPDDKIEGQNTRLYLLDLWIPPNADVARFRLEVQLKVADWVVRPMELRVLPARVPDIPSTDAAKPPRLPPVEQGADFPALDAVREYLSRSPLRVDPQPLTVSGIIRRNAIQDMALAASLDPAIAGPEAVQRRAIDLEWNNFRFFPRFFGAEWYLRLRDFLFTR